MSITPLNITTAGDSGTYVPTAPAATKPDPVVSTVAPAEPSSAKRATEVEAVNAVQVLNNYADSMSASSLNFILDKDTGNTIVKVIDRDTDKLIRQIPTEEAVALAKSLDRMQGLLINDQA
jgi:flagellar protein FlaG